MRVNKGNMPVTGNADRCLEAHVGGAACTGGGDREPVSQRTFASEFNEEAASQLEGSWPVAGSAQDK